MLLRLVGGGYVALGGNLVLEPAEGRADYRVLVDNERFVGRCYRFDVEACLPVIPNTADVRLLEFWLGSESTLCVVGYPILGWRFPDMIPICHESHELSNSVCVLDLGPDHAGRGRWSLQEDRRFETFEEVEAWARAELEKIEELENRRAAERRQELENA